MGISELARRTGIPKSTVHLGLQTMRRFGFIEQEDGSDRYLLGLQAAQIGVQALESSPVAAALAPGMKRLAERSSEAVSLGVRVERSVVFVKRFETSFKLGTSITVGSHMPLHASASGKCLLSGMEQAEIVSLYPEEELPSQSTNTIRERGGLLREIAAVRQGGYASNMDEWLDGVSAAAVPVRFGDQVVAALSIAGPTTRFCARDWLDDLFALISLPGVEQRPITPEPDGTAPDARPTHMSVG